MDFKKYGLAINIIIETKTGLIQTWFNLGFPKHFDPLET